MFNSEHTVMTSGPWAMRRRSPGVVWRMNSFSIPPEGNPIQQQHVANMMQIAQLIIISCDVDTTLNYI